MTQPRLLLGEKQLCCVYYIGMCHKKTGPTALFITTIWITTMDDIQIVRGRNEMISWFGSHRVPQPAFAFAPVTLCSCRINNTSKRTSNL